MMKVKVFKREVLKIANRTIISNNSFVQISNITRVWYGRLDVNIPYIKIGFALVVGGVLAIGDLSGFGFVGVLIFFVSMGFAGYYMYLLSHYTLNFELTSGEVYAFTSLDQNFLKESFEKVQELIENPKNMKGEYVMNFDSCKIEVIDKSIKYGDGAIVTGDNSNVVSGNSGSIANVGGSQNVVHANTNCNNKSEETMINNYNIDYKRLEEELETLKAIDEVRKHTSDLELIEKATKYAKEKNESKLKATLSKISEPTIKIIQFSSSFTTILKFIMDIFNNK